MNTNIALLISMFILLLNSCKTQEKSADYHTIPLPENISLLSERPFVLESGTRIFYPEDNLELKRNAEFLADYFAELMDIELNVTPGEGSGINLNFIQNNELHPESYNISINPDKIDISSTTSAGIFYGIQTLRKSAVNAIDLKILKFPSVEINDAPAFNYRGMMLDVSRHFFSVDFIKKFIDILALHHINTFHWHLTDDQGWRVEIKRYPKLTEIGAYRDETVVGRSLVEFDEKRYGGFYTQDDIKNIVDYAQEQYITIIPEIDMPGHMMAALASYNELGCTNEPYKVGTYWGVYEDVLCAGSNFTYEFIEGVLEEIMELFPSEYIHVGGDECPKIRWEECPKCQAKIKELNLKEKDGHTPEEQLQSHIISFAGKVLEKHGRKLIGWDEILEGGLPDGATVMSWRGMKGGVKAAKSGHNVIMAPNNYVYFNFYQDANIKEEPLTFNYLPLEKVYSFKPIPPSLSRLEKKFVKGGQANLWSEFVVNPDIAEYQLLPRLAALSEVLWSSPGNNDYEEFQKRLLRIIPLYEANDYNYAKHIFDVMAHYHPDFSKRQINITLESADNPEIFYTLDGTEVTKASNLYLDTIQIDWECTLKAVAQRPGRETRLLEETIYFNKATLRPIEMITPINDAFKFNGAQTLVDGLKGQANYNTGRWIGVHNRDIEVLIDLENLLEISSLRLSTCVIMSRTAFDARSLSIFGSTDGADYELISRKDFPQMEITDEDVSVYGHELKFNPIKARWVKVIVESEKSIPEWHERHGAPGWLFVDEIEIK